MRFRLTLSVAVLLLLSRPAQGDINNCALMLSPLEHDYGALSRDRQTFISTPQGKVAPLSERRSNLSVTCLTPQHIALRFSGDRQTDGSFRFGAKGMLRVTIHDAVLDGNSMLLTKTKQQGIATGDTTAASHSLRAADEIAVGSSSTVQGNNLNVTLTVTPYLAESAFTVSDTDLQEEIIHIELLDTY